VRGIKGTNNENAHGGITGWGRAPREKRGPKKGKRSGCIKKIIRARASNNGKKTLGERGGVSKGKPCHGRLLGKFS